MNPVTTIIIAYALIVAVAARPQSYVSPDGSDEITRYDEFSLIFGKKDSCKTAEAKLQQCTSKAAGEDPKWQQSIMTEGKTARGCLQEVKHEQQKDSCMKPFMKLLGTKCGKETQKMIDNECKIYSEGEHTTDTFDLLMRGDLNDKSSFEERGIEEVFDVKKNMNVTPQCKMEMTQLQQCVDKISEKDRGFRSTVETAASVERICLQAATENSEMKACTKQLKIILKAKCPKETNRALNVCNIKTGELRASIFR